jgi:hypothetical protein
LKTFASSKSSGRYWKDFKKRHPKFTNIPQRVTEVTHFLSEFLKPVLATVHNMYLIGGYH